MADSVDVLDTAVDKASVTATVQSWLDENGASVESIDEIETFEIGSRRLGVMIVYTESA